MLVHTSNVQDWTQLRKLRNLRYFARPLTKSTKFIQRVAGKSRPKLRELRKLRKLRNLRYFARPLAKSMKFIHWVAGKPRPKLRELRKLRNFTQWMKKKKKERWKNEPGIFIVFMYSYYVNYGHCSFREAWLSRVAGKPRPKLQKLRKLRNLRKLQNLRKIVKFVTAFNPGHKWFTRENK